ncbi:unnamed protein product [Moneuplotes crassus]|uniref:Uncharacterized protein n=1 Tax=Euplotes crassus TaxID=5936 RepID=A0AAD2D6E4_EUPCR|nr:unnamed protein product [Moneuplotes crassus]
MLQRLSAKCKSETDNLRSIKLQEYKDCLEEDPFELLRVLESCFDPSNMKEYKDYCKKLQEESEKRPSPIRKDCKTKIISTKKKTKCLTNKMFDSDYKEVKLTKDLKCRLYKWTESFCGYQELKAKYQVNPELVSLDTYHYECKVQWLKGFMQGKMTEHYERVKIEGYEVDTEQKEQDLNDILVEKSSNDSTSSFDNLKILSTNSEDKCFIALKQSEEDESDFQEETDTYKIFQYYLKEAEGLDMPKVIDFAGDISNDLDEFDDWFKSFKSLLVKIKNFYGCAHDFLKPQKVQCLIEIDKIQECISSAEDLVIPPVKELEFLQFLIEQYDFWISKLERYHKLLMKGFDPNRSLHDKKAICIEANRLKDNLNFFPVIRDSDLPMIKDIMAVIFLCTVEDMLNDTSNRVGRYQYDCFAIEVDIYPSEHFIYDHPVYLEFKEYYEFASLCDELANSDKIAQKNKIDPDKSLDSFLERCKASKINLTDEMDCITYRVECFKENRDRLRKLLEEKEDYTEFLALEKNFDECICICKKEKSIIKEIKRKVESLAQEMVNNLFKKYKRRKKKNSKSDEENEISFIKRAELLKASKNTITTPPQSRSPSQSSSSSLTDEDPNSLTRAGILIERYQDLECKFSEGEIFQNTVVEEIGAFEKICRKIGFYEKYLGNKHSIDLVDEDTYFEFNPREEDPTLAKEFKESQIERIGDAGDSDFDADVGIQKTILKEMWKKVRKLRIKLASFSISFGYKANEINTALEALEVRAFSRLLSLQLMTQADSSCLYDQLNSVFEGVKPESSFRKQYKPNVTFKYVKDTFCKKNYLNNDLFYLVPTSETQLFQNMINIFCKYEALCRKNKDLDYLREFQKTSRGLCIDFSTFIDNCRYSIIRRLPKEDCASDQSKKSKKDNKKARNKKSEGYKTMQSKVDDNYQSSKDSKGSNTRSRKRRKFEDSSVSSYNSGTPMTNLHAKEVIIVNNYYCPNM